ncbi:MAG: Mini-ribonuclease 3 [Halanaerobiaceae bacterium]
MDKEKEASLLSPALLAYIGDSIFELKTREYFLEQGYRKLNTIHQQTVTLVNASSQAEALKMIEDKLNRREKNIVRRGKNTDIGTVSKNADIGEYRLSTGLEALFGYLYLADKRERLNELWQEIIGGMSCE